MFKLSSPRRKTNYLSGYKSFYMFEGDGGDQSLTVSSMTCPTMLDYNWYWMTATAPDDWSISNLECAEVGTHIVFFVWNKLRLR